MTVKRTSGGLASNWLCDHAQPGMTLESLTPAGAFTVRPADSELIFMAAGSGITPVISMIRAQLLQSGRRVTLVYANRDRDSVIFDAEFNGLVCHAADLDVPNPAADPNLARYARALLESLPQSSPHTLSHDVRRTIYLSLPSGGATCAWVAQSLGRSLRTFQRELDQEGVSFSELLAEVRTNLARRYMESPKYEVGQVAALLGYSTHGAFTRWFALQFGLPPTEWRRRAMALEPSQDARTGAAVPA